MVNPKEKIFAARSMDAISGIFLLNPIFMGEANYGYMMCRINENKFADYNVSDYKELIHLFEESK